MTCIQHQALRARVFISCGQSKRTDEVETARLIAQRLHQLGFDPYVAVEEQTLRGFKENIFAQLEKSEYFIFVDFKREQLAESNPPVCRGSLFSHQELALASFLEISVVAFQENGVKSDDGILRFLQTNATTFSDRPLLPNIIADEVQRRGWNAGLRNEVVLEREPKQKVDAHLGNTQQVGRFFHLSVRNLHSRKTATNCYAYLEKATRLNPYTDIPLNTIEFKWAGYVLPNAHVSPGSVRRVDAFWINHNNPTVLQFNTFSDSTEFIPQIQGEGEYELSYSIVSDNFPPARISLKLKLSASLERTTLT